MNNGKNLETESLLMTPFKKEGTKLFYELSTDSFIRKYLWDDEKISLQLAKETIEKNVEYFQEKGFGIWKLLEKKSEEIIGYAGLWHFFEENQPQLIYAIQKKHTKKGLATEAAREILRYSLEDLKFKYLIASMDEENLESMHVAERIGMIEYEKKIIENKSTVFYIKR